VAANAFEESFNDAANPDPLHETAIDGLPQSKCSGEVIIAVL
jgi:hypothetical protein